MRAHLPGSWPRRRCDNPMEMDGYIAPHTDDTEDLDREQHEIGKSWLYILICWVALVATLSAVIGRA